MTETTQRPPTGASATGEPAPPKRYHHGRTPAAWAGSALAFVGILVGGIGMVFTPINWVVFTVGAVLFVLGGIVAVVLKKLGMGAD